jgi:hypothetical protein
MKNIQFLLAAVAAATACVVLTGCDGISGTPYRRNTVAAAILGDRPAQPGMKSARDNPHADTTSAAVAGGGSASGREQSGTSAPIVVPVEAGDPVTSCYLHFSPVQVHLDAGANEQTVQVYTDVRPQCLMWRVSLVKDGREYYNFIASGQSHLLGQAISLQPLALEPDMPVPDKIVVTLVK